MKDDFNNKHTPKRGPGRDQPSGGKDIIGDPEYEKHFDEEHNDPDARDHEDAESDYDRNMRAWANQPQRDPVSPEEAWKRKRAEAGAFIEKVSMLSIVLSLLCLVPEYFVWQVHFEQWQKLYDFEPSSMLLAALLALGTVASMAASWYCVFECWKNKRLTGRIGGGLLAITVMIILTFVALFTFESMAFYEFMRRDTIDAFGEPVPGKSHMSALTSIGSWAGLNFIMGLITGYCTSNIIHKE